MLRALAQALLGTLVVSCLLTPAVYALIEASYEEAPWPYSRVFDRVVLVVLVTWLFRVRRSMELERLRPFVHELATRRGWRRIGLGALATAASGLLMLPLLVQGPMLEWHPDRTIAELFGRAIRLIPAALLIGLIEETLFRLVLFERMRRTWTTAGAALCSSLIYAAVHFVSPDKQYVFPGWSPTVGFEYLGAMVGKFMQPGVPDGLVGLTLVGLTLCLALGRSRSLALCVGLHAGWILAAKLGMKIARRAPEVEFPSGAGRRNFLVTQPITWVAILLVAAGVWWLTAPRRLAERESPTARDAA